jgi:hypothetical protein
MKRINWKPMLDANESWFYRIELQNFVQGTASLNQLRGLGGLKRVVHRLERLGVKRSRSIVRKALVRW